MREELIELDLVGLEAFEPTVPRVLEEDQEIDNMDYGLEEPHNNMMCYYMLCHYKRGHGHGVL